MSFKIEPVRTRSQLAEFIGLPARLYEGMPGYAAPLDRERRELLDPERSPFFTHGIAGYWIARQGSRAVGRISAQIDHLLPRGENETEAPGLFGCLDAVADEDVVRALTGTAEQWLHRRGRRVVRGPFQLSINNEAGLLLEGHTEPPMFMLPWQPRYLDRHLRAAGYDLAKTLYSYVLDLETADMTRLMRMVGGDRERPEFTVRGLRTRELDAEAAIVARLFNDSWRDNWGFTPVSEAEVRTAMRRFRPLLSSYSTTVLEYRGEPAAFGTVVPNLLEATADIGHAPTLAGWIRLAARMMRGQYRSHRILLFGVASRFRNSVAGAAIAAAVIRHNILIAQARKLRSIEAGWVLEDNRAIIDMIERTGFRRNRRFGLYEKSLGGKSLAS